MFPWTLFSNNTLRILAFVTTSIFNSWNRLGLGGLTRSGKRCHFLWRLLQFCGVFQFDYVCYYVHANPFHIIWIAACLCRQLAKVWSALEQMCLHVYMSVCTLLHQIRLIQLTTEQIECLLIMLALDFAPIW